VDAYVEHHIDITDDVFVQGKSMRLLLLELQARDVSSWRDDSMIFFTNTLLDTSRAFILNTTVHALISQVSLIFDVNAL
jgi:hypothetical protein